MTCAQSKQFVLRFLRKFPMLRGFKSSELNPGYVYAPYIPLMMSPSVAEFAEIGRQLQAEHQRIHDHIEASRHVNLIVDA